MPTSISDQSASELLRQEMHTAWKYATRAVNVCESIGLTDTRTAMVEIVVKISQQLEFIETELQAARIAERRESRRD